MALAPGARRGAYEIIARIGAGGMGEVYRARDTKLGRDVALKVLPEAFGSDRERLARFDREARTLAALIIHTSRRSTVSSAGTADVTASPTITSPALMTGAGVMLGTPAYMSPEQGTGRRGRPRASLSEQPGRCWSR